MPKVSFNFGSRKLRHNLVAYDKVSLRSVPLKKGFADNHTRALEVIFPMEQPAVAGRALQTFLQCPGEARGTIDAQEFASLVFADDLLRPAFLNRDGQELTEASLRTAIIGRLGTKDSLKRIAGASTAARAMTRLAAGDIDRYNQIRKSTTMHFDFTGMTVLQGVNLRGMDTFGVTLSDTYAFTPAVRRRTFGFVRVNSGFCAGMRIDPTMDAPSMIFEGFKTELIDSHYGAYLALRGRGIEATDADIQFRPRRVQGRPNRQSFIFEEEYLANLPRIRQAVTAILDDSRMPVTIGGDHSIALATQGTINEHYMATTGKPIGLIWVDAHADINTGSTSPSGNLHGGPVAGLLGLLDSPEFSRQFPHNLDPKKIVYIAERDLDPGEVEIIRRNGIRWMTMREIREKGLETLMQEAYAIAADGTAGVSVSFDIDAFDASLVPGTGTPVPNGLNLEDGEIVCRAISTWDNLVAFELVEINPANDVERRTQRLGQRVLLQAMLGLGSMKDGSLDERPGEAIKGYKRVIAENPDNQELLTISHYHLGMAYLKQKRFAEAVEEFQMVITTNPSFSLARTKLGIACFKHGEAIFTKGSYQPSQKVSEAISLFKLALAVDPNNATIHNVLARAYLNQLMFEEAIEEHRKAVAIHPNDATLYCDFGNTLLHACLGPNPPRGMLVESLTVCEKALQIDPSNAKARGGIKLALFEIGSHHVGDGKFDEAIAVLKRAIEFEPSWPAAHGWLARAYVEKGRLDDAEVEYAKAVEIYEKALAKDSRDPEACHSIGWARNHLIEFREKYRRCR
ncbi:MAG: arginase family protein [Candidatus Margulisiibacteriota bacterium]